MRSILIVLLVSAPVAAGAAEAIIPASCLSLAMREGVMPTSLADARRQVQALVRTGDGLARQCKLDYYSGREKQSTRR